MRLSDLIKATLGDMLGRLLWRAGAALFAVAALLAAAYHLTAAATLALSAHYGALDAYLLVGGGYAIATLIVAAILLATRRGKPAATSPAAALLSSPRNAQVALLLEAAMIGFLAAKKAP